MLALTNRILRVFIVSLTKASGPVLRTPGFYFGEHMTYTVLIINSILLGIGLAMDAFSVSMANGLNEPDMSASKFLAIAGTFAAFQAAMPMIGWFCVHTIAEAFSAFQKFIPWTALILLVFIGGKMILESGKASGSGDAANANDLFIQGIATSIDALSVGFTIAGYDWKAALAASLIIGAVTFAICSAGIAIGRKFGMKLAGNASLAGGMILILIGLEIFITGVF